MNSEDFEEYAFADEENDLPAEKRLGFFFESSADVRPDYDSAVRMAQEFYAANSCFVDDEDYEWTIQSLTADEQEKRFAWVEWRFKQGRGEHEYHDYYLKARQATGEYWRWEIETYNPYFGCDVKLLKWLKDAMLLVYEEKHYTYAARINGEGINRIKISSEWKIEDGFLIDERDLQKINLQTFEIEE